MEHTIAAIATAPGAGGIAIVRVSGMDAPDIARRVFCPKKGKLQSRMMTYGKIIDVSGEEIDEAMAVLFTAPNSYTRENVLELHCHGGSVQADRALRACLRAGARLAEPGEFTRRAFVNGRIDLAQAEAVMRLIGSKSEQAAKLGMAQLDGALSKSIKAMQDRLLGQIALLEAAIDYPEDDLERDGAEQVRQTAEAMVGELDLMLREARRAIRINEGVRVAIAGRPNVGKSSLLNRLAGYERAIVTERPGTTRDVLSERVTVKGLPLTVVDTAGLRETADEIERIGVARARKELDTADIILLVWEKGVPLTAQDKEILDERENVILVKNKSDLPEPDMPPQADGPNCVEISALTGEGTSRLLDAIYEMAIGNEGISETALTHERQAQAASAAREALCDASASAALDMPPECLCEDLRRAWKALGLITGDSADEALITRIFSDFCLGK